jgi:RNA-directed DNA polymerase
VAVDAAPIGPGRGRRSRRGGPRVWGSGPSSGSAGIVPAAQAPVTLPGRTPAVHSLMPCLIDVAHLHRAARACMRRASAPGADGMSWAAYRQGLRDRLAGLAGRLRDGTWHPGPLRSVDITTYTGKVFTAVVPTVEDRIVHRAMRQVIDPILELHALADWVSGYRPGRNRITAVRQAASYLADGYRWIVDVDVAGASAGGTADQFVTWLAAYVHDGTFLARFRTALAGLPTPLAPGSGLWPVAFHLRMSEVDKHLAGLRVVRFADNYTAFATDPDEAHAAHRRLTTALATVGLTAHPGKSRIRAAGSASPEDLYLIAG